MRESAYNAPRQTEDETDGYTDRSRCCPHIFTSLHNTTDAGGTFLAKAPFCRRLDLSPNFSFAHFFIFTNTVSVYWCPFKIRSCVGVVGEVLLFVIFHNLTLFGLCAPSGLVHSLFCNSHPPGSYSFSQLSFISMFGRTFRLGRQFQSTKCKFLFLFDFNSSFPFLFC
jgi:hypothetical protein